MGRGLPHSKTLSRSSKIPSGFYDNSHAGHGGYGSYGTNGSYSTHTTHKNPLPFQSVLLALFLSFALHAQSAPPAPETVIVPYDATKPVQAQHPDQLYVPYDRFVELWDAAKRTRRGPEKPDAGTAYLLDSARYEGVLSEDAVTFRGVIALSTLSQWAAVPLPFHGAIVNSLKLDGAAAALSDGSLKTVGGLVAWREGSVVVETPGRHTLDVTFQIPLKRGDAAFGFGIPRTPGTLVSLTLPRPQMRATIEAASGTVEKTVNGQKQVIATLGETDRVQVSLDSSNTLTRMTQPALAQIRSELHVTRALDLIKTTFEFSFAAARQDCFTVYLDSGITLVDLKAANLKSWKLREKNGSVSPSQGISGPTARLQTSLGHRPRTPEEGAIRAVGPTQCGEQGLERAFSPDPLPIKDLGRCPRLVWGRAFGAENRHGAATLRAHSSSVPPCLSEKASFHLCAKAGADIAKEAGVQVLEIVLSEPARDKYSFEIRCERSGAALPAQGAVPFIGAAAQRVENEAALLSGDGIELTPQPGAGFRQVVWNGEPEPGAHLMGAYAFNGSNRDTGFQPVPLAPGQSRSRPGPAYRVRLAEIKREAQVNYVYQVDRRKIELIASLSLDAKGHELFSATVAMPAGFTVQAVQGERLADWWLDGDALRVRFSGATPGKTPLMVYLVRRFSSAPDKLELTPLVVREFAVVRGEAVIAAHKGVSATLELSDAKEIAPETAAREFSILPPLERKRGISFTTQSFRGTVALGVQAARMSSTWVMDARVHESWVSLSTRVQTALRQGSIGSLSFSLPAGLPEAHVAGAEIRETGAKLVGDRRVYDVVFQNDLYDQAEFTINFEIPSISGSTALPALEIAGQDRTTGFVLVGNASEYEMQLRPAGLDPAQRDEIPFLPELGQSASLFRAHPGWSLGVTTMRLEKAASRAAFVAWVEITTAFRADGTEWNRAVYHLQNRSLQFLPVKLPDGAELVSVRVAKQLVRADSGSAEGQEVTLVPLIKTKQGDLSFEVELVYRMAGQQRGELGPVARRFLHDPTLVGVTVEKTLWNLFVPHDRALTRIDGNMQPVLNEVNTTEKLAGSLQELKELASVVSSRSVSQSARQNAYSNYQELAKTVELGVKTAELSARQRTAGNAGIVSGKDAVSQSSLITQRAGEMQSELEQQNAQVKSGAGKLFLEGSVNTVDALVMSNAKARNEAAADSNALSWSRNASYAAKQPGVAGGKAESEKRMVGAASDESFGVNDYVVMQKRANDQSDRSDLAPAAAASPAPLALDEATKRDDGAVRSKVAKLQQMQMAVTGANNKDATSHSKGRERALNTARGNVLLQTDAEEERSTSNAVSSPVSESSQFKMELGNAYGRSLGLQQAPRGAGGSAANGLAGGMAFGGGTRGYAASAAPALALPASPTDSKHSANREVTDAPQESLADQLPRPSGRISLAVDFPTEGQAVHFKKLKANASLEVWIKQPAAHAHRPWIVQFLLMAALLALIGILHDRRRARA